MADIGAIRLYRVNGEPFFCFPNWGTHQRIQTKKSKFPPPEEINGDSPYSTVDHGEPPPESNPNPIQSESESNPNPNPECVAHEVRSTARVKRAFTKPTVEDVGAYCGERGNGVDAQRFCDFYEAKGWKIGKEPMKDWKAAVRTWEQREGDRKPQGAMGRALSNLDALAARMEAEERGRNDES